MTDPGRTFILSQIDGRKLGGLGTVRISGLTGDPLSAGMVSDIALVDEAGIWLRAQDIRFEWTATSLFAGELDISLLSVRLVDILRPPPAGRDADAPSAPDVNVRVDQFGIELLRLAQPILGLEARYALHGALLSQSGGAGFVRADLSPLSGPVDKANLKLEWDPQGALVGEARITGPPGGLASQILQAPQNKAVAFSGRVEGFTDRFKGDAALSFGDEAAAVLAFGRNDDAVSISGKLQPVDWPLISELLKRAGGPISFKAGVDVTDIEEAPATLEVSAPAGLVQLDGLVSLPRGALTSPMTLRAENVSLAAIAPPLSGLAEATGEITVGSSSDVLWNGSIRARQMTWPSGSASSVSGSAQLKLEGPHLSWRTGQMNVTGLSIGEMADLGQGNYSATTAGEMNLRNLSLDVYDTRIEGTAGSLTVRGVVDGRTGAVDLSGAVQLLKLTPPLPLSGAISARWTVRQASTNKPLQIDVSGEGRELETGFAAIDDLIGPAARFGIRGVLRSGLFRLERALLEGQGMTADLSGDIAGDGRISGKARARMSGPREIGGILLKGASVSAIVSGSIQRPRLEAHLDDSGLSISGLVIDSLGGRMALDFGDTLTGDFEIGGVLLGQHLETTGKIRSVDGGIRLSGLRAGLGRLRGEAESIDVRNAGLSADFKLSGELAGVANIERGALTLNGSLSLVDGLSGSVSGRLSDLRSGSARLDRVTFTGDIRRDTVSLNASLRGQLTAPLSLDVELAGSRFRDAWRGEAGLKGDIDGLPVSTLLPARWSLASDGWSVESALSAFDGALSIEAGTSGSQAKLSADIRRINLRPLSRLTQIGSLNGVVSGIIAFSNNGTETAGALQLEIQNANPDGVTTNPVNVDLRASLNENRLSGTMTGAGQGFSLDASLSLPLRAEEGFNIGVDDNAELAAAATIDGRAEKLWALLGPEDQTLRGELIASLEARGSLSRPSLSGAFRIKEGVYEHSETGLLLNSIAAAGVFDRLSARMTDFVATDGAGGLLSAEGTADWSDGLTARIDFSARRLRTLKRDDRFAIVSGEGRLDLDEAGVLASGQLYIDEARISVEQPTVATIPTLPGLRRVNFPDRPDDPTPGVEPPWLRPLRLDIALRADRRIVIFGRGLDTEWGTDVVITGTIADPSVRGSATLVRGNLDLAGQRFSFGQGSVALDGPIRLARFDISAERASEDITATVRVSGTPVEPRFVLESKPALPQDEVLARVLFNRSLAELSPFEAAQLAASLAQLAGGQARFDPVSLVRQATGLDRISFGADNGAGTVAAGKYLTDEVYLQVGAGGSDGVAAEVEWQPARGLSIVSSATANGDTRVAIRWKEDFGAPEPAGSAAAPDPMPD